MALSVGPVGNIAAPEPIRVPGATSKPGAFQEVLGSAIRHVEQSRDGASQAVERFLSGEGQELHAAVLAAQRAELALDLFLQVRNKVVQAYQEIMRMQV
jgi:flagellar hook-basal body complex protein FliE